MTSPLNPPIHETFSLQYHKDPITNTVNWKWFFSKAAEKSLELSRDQAIKNERMEQKQDEDALNTSSGSTESTKEAIESLLYIYNSYHSDSDDPVDDSTQQNAPQPWKGFSTARGKKIELQTDLTNEAVINNLKRKFELDDNSEQVPSHVAFTTARNLFAQNTEKKEEINKVPSRSDKPGYTLGLWSEDVTIRDRGASRDVLIKLETNVQSADNEEALAWKCRPFLQQDPYACCVLCNNVDFMQRSCIYRLLSSRVSFRRMLDCVGQSRL